MAGREGRTEGRMRKKDRKRKNECLCLQKKDKRKKNQSKIVFL